MEFPQNYFDDEIREDFYVSGIMKRVWAASMEILSDIDSLCKKHNIKWFADYGTLLGAVRHGGVIPWDDDFDICMLRDDYDRFLMIAKEELPEPYKVLSCENGYDDLMARIVNSDSIRFDKDFLDKFHQCYFGIGVDIFPLDDMAPSEEERMLHKKEIEEAVSYETLFSSRNNTSANIVNIHKAAKRLEKICNYPIDMSGDLKQQFYLAVENLCAKYNGVETDRVMLAPIWAKYGTKSYPKRCFSNSIMMPFETMQMPVSVEYDTMLSIEYGDYMKILKGGASHGYPCFLGQEKQVINALEEYPFLYKFHEKDLQNTNRQHNIPLEETTKKEVIIIPYRANTWSRIEDIWREERKNGANVHVIMPPYYYKNGLGAFSDEQDESDLLPEYVTVTPYDQYNFETMHPDVIYIQNPYDECNYTSSVHPFYYASNLKQYTQKLVYIPWYSMKELSLENEKINQTMQYYCLVPGIMHADEVIVETENIRQGYIKRLVDMTGEKNRTLWENKIVVKETTKEEEKKIKHQMQEDILKTIPTEWKSVIYGEDGRKSIVLYDITPIAFIQGGYHAIEKLREVLNIFKNNDKIAFVWRGNTVIFDMLKLKDEAWEKEYSEIVNTFREEGWGIYDEVYSFREEAILADAFYGDKGYVARRFESLGKPVMIQDIKLEQEPEIPDFSKVKENEDGKLAIHISACVPVQNKLYFVPNEMNALGVLDLTTGDIALIDKIPEEGIGTTALIATIKYLDGKLIFIPSNAKYPWIYEIKNKIWKKILIRDEMQNFKFSSAEICERKCFMFPDLYKSIVCVDMDTMNISYYDDYFKKNQLVDSCDECKFLAEHTRVENTVYLLKTNENAILKFDMQSKEYEWLKLGNRERLFRSIAYNGKDFYLSPRNMDTIVKWDGKKSILEIKLPKECIYEIDGLIGVRIEENIVVFQGKNCDTIKIEEDDFEDVLVDKQRYNFQCKISETQYYAHKLDSGHFVFWNIGKKYEHDVAIIKEKMEVYLNRFLAEQIDSIFDGFLQEDAAVRLPFMLDCLVENAKDKVIHFDKKKIVFLPYKAGMWDSLESIWLAAKEDERCEAYVVPIPYYDKNGRGELVGYHYDGEFFPEYVPIEDYRQFDFSDADVMYIHNPYDQGNHVTSIEPQFYSDKLKRYTKKLVYVPYYATTGGMGEGQAMCIAYQNVDYIITQSEKYEKFFDERVPREKLIPLGSPKFDRVINLCNNPPKISTEWEQKIAGRKVFFYNTSLQGMLVDTNAFLKKMEYVFHTFEENKKGCLLWRPHPLFETTMKSVRPQYLERYYELKKYYLEKSIGIFDDTDDIEETISHCDVYIGDEATSVTSLFSVAGKPVFILNNWIHRAPGEKDWIAQLNVNYIEDSDNQWKVTQGNKLYYSKKNNFCYSYVCDLSEYAYGDYYKIVYQYEDKVYVFPLNAQDILLVNEKGICERIELERKIERAGAFIDVKIWKEYAFIIPYKYPYIVRFNMKTKEIDYIGGCLHVFSVHVNEEDKIGGACIWKQYLLIASPINKNILILDCETLDVQLLEVPAKHYRGAISMKPDREEIWLLPFTGTDVIKWNPLTGQSKEYRCRIEDFACFRRPEGTKCMERAFKNIALTETTVILSPIWGNKFIEIVKETDEIKEYRVPFGCEIEDMDGYRYSSRVGFFLHSTINNKNLYFLEQERRLYEIDFVTNEWTEIKVSFDVHEIQNQEIGFGKISEWMRYGCVENACISLTDIINETAIGEGHNKELQIQAMSDIITNGDGTCGKKIHEFLMKQI